MAVAFPWRTGNRMQPPFSNERKPKVGVAWRKRVGYEG